MKSSGRSHEKTKLDPDLGTRYCPCDYHEQKQEAKRKKLAALGVKDSVNYYDPDGYHNRPPHHHTENPDDFTFHDCSSQSHDHGYPSYQDTYSSSSRPEPEPEQEPEPPHTSSHISGTECYGVDESRNVVDELDCSATGIESEYYYPAHENGFPVDEPDAGDWRSGDYRFDRCQWEANSAQQFYDFVRGSGRYW